MVEYLALDLAVTVRHDGRGGVADDLSEPRGLTAWVREHADSLGPWAPEFEADSAAWDRAIELRQAIRAQFAHAVAPGPASPADVHRLPPLPEAVDRVNAAAARVPITPRLSWPDGAAPRRIVHTGDAADSDLLTAALARSAIDLLTGPHRTELRACTAPRCVRYFIKGHGRQEFCKPACGNRSRAARHYRRHRPATEPAA
ncbi:MAG: CGNR zinc finger domain-containing protein [Stackebrandtia sp.]